MIEHSADIEKLSTALLQAQGAMDGAAKDSKNPHFKNTYASLESVIAAAKPALQTAGVAFTQAPGQIIENAVEVTTMLMHTSGQWLRSTLHVPLMKRDAQSVGSAITYGCRYALMATLGLPPVDDDGAAASAPAPKPTQRAAPQTPFDEPADRTIIDTMLFAMKRAGSRDELKVWGAGQAAEIEALPEAQRVEMRAAYAAFNRTLPEILSEAA